MKGDGNWDVPSVCPQRVQAEAGYVRTQEVHVLVLPGHFRAVWSWGSHLASLGFSFLMEIKTRTLTLLLFMSRAIIYWNFANVRTIPTEPSVPRPPQALLSRKEISALHHPQSWKCISVVVSRRRQHFTFLLWRLR